MVFSVARGRPQRKRGVAGGHGCSNRGGRGGCVHGYGAVDRVTAAWRHRLLSDWRHSWNGGNFCYLHKYQRTCWKVSDVHTWVLFFEGVVGILMLLFFSFFQELELYLFWCISWHRICSCLWIAILFSFVWCLQVHSIPSATGHQPVTGRRSHDQVWEGVCCEEDAVVKPLMKDRPVPRPPCVKDH